MFNKILLATDGSYSALKATEVAGDLAGQFNSEIVVLNVFLPVAKPTPVYAMSGGLSRDSAQSVDEAQNDIIEQSARLLQKANVPFFALKATGTPSEEIRCAAERVKADLIIVGRCGANALAAPAAASVSNHVADDSRCPILTVVCCATDTEKISLEYYAGIESRK